MMLDEIPFRIEQIRRELADGANADHASADFETVTYRIDWLVEKLDNIAEMLGALAERTRP